MLSALLVEGEIFMMTLGAIVTGFILDLIFGDPHWLPHPICLIGNLISFLEKHLRKLFGFSNNGLLFGGALMVVIVLTLPSLCLLHFLLQLTNSILGWALL